MPLDFGKPDTTDNYATSYTPAIKNGQTALAQMLDPAVAGTLTAVPTGAKRVNAGEFQQFNGSSWATYLLNYIPKGATPTRGSYTISTSVGVWAGFTFSAAVDNLELLFATTGTVRKSGVYSGVTSAWEWRWEDGILVAGTVPYSRLSGTPDLSTYAPKASPGLTGTPTAPTAAVDTSTTQIASTAFVTNQAGTSTPSMNSGSGSAGSSKRYSRQDHVHPDDTSKANLASPALTGAPTVNGEPIGLNVVPVNQATGAYTAALADVGGMIDRTGAVTIPAGVFSQDDAFLIYNASGSNQSLIQASGVTLRLAGTTTTGTRTMSPSALVSIICRGSNDFIVSGAGLS